MVGASVREHARRTRRSLEDEKGRALIVLTKIIVCVSRAFSTSRSSRPGFSFSLHMITVCVMRSAALPAEPIWTLTGLRMYLQRQARENE